MAYMLFLWGEILGVGANFGAVFILDRFGRRMSFAVNAVIVAISAAAFPHVVVEGGTIGVYICYLTIVFCTGLMWCVLNCFVPEAFPTTLRGTGTGASSCSGRVSAALTPIVIGQVLEHSVHVAFYMIGGIAFIGAVIACCIQKEMANEKLTDECDTEQSS